jgi:uncharacterized protein (UPF0248 family)
MYQHVKEAQRNNYTKRSVHYKIISILKKGGKVLYEKHDHPTDDSAFLMEKELIVKYGRKDLGTGILCNLTEGGEGAGNTNPESVERRAAKHRGMKRSEESKQRMSEAQQHLRMGGLVTSLETKEKMKNDPKRKMTQSQEIRNKRRSSAKKVPILQCDIKGTVIQEWDSLSSAALALGTTPTNILTACKGLSKTHMGFVWKKRDMNSLPIYAKRWVLQFNLDGIQLIQKYKTTKIAEVATGCGSSSIIKCCNGTIYTAGGFVWKYGDDIIPDLHILQIHNVTGEVVGKFTTIGTAAKYMNIHVSQISKCINKRPKYSTAGGFRWERRD